MVLLLDLLAQGGPGEHLMSFLEMPTTIVQIGFWYFGGERPRRDLSRYEWGLQAVHWEGTAVDLGARGFAPLARPPEQMDLTLCEVLCRPDEDSDSDATLWSGFGESYHLRDLQRQSATAVYSQMATGQIIEGRLAFCSVASRKLFRQVSVPSEVYEREIGNIGDTTLCNPARVRDFLVVAGERAWAQRWVRKWGEVHWDLSQLCGCGKEVEVCPHGECGHLAPGSPRPNESNVAEEAFPELDDSLELW